MSRAPTSRIMSFRLSEEQYGKCRELCLSHGIQSISEMARAGINLLLQQPGRLPQESLQSRVADLEGRFHMLLLELKRLSPSAGSKNVNGAGA